MPTERKIELVRELTDKLSRAQVTIVADYRGLTVADMQTLRGQLRSLGSELRVAKNTLTTIAARQAGQAALEPALAGPTALVFVYDDVAGSARAVTDFARTSRILQVRGAVLGDRLVDAEGVATLATLPPRDRLQAQVLGALIGPVAGVVSLFSSVAQSLVSILDQKAQQMGGGAADAPPEAPVPVS